MLGTDLTDSVANFANKLVKKHTEGRAKRITHGNAISLHNEMPSSWKFDLERIVDL